MSLHDQRAADAPPVDALAEAVALDHLTFCCYERIDSVDLEPLLVFPEHVWLWRTAKRVKAHMGDPRGAAFFMEYVAEIRRTHTQAEALINLLLYARERATERSFDDFEDAADDDPRLSVHQHGHNLDYWLARLKRIAEARALISASQAIAERAWRAPDVPFTAASAQRLLDAAERKEDVVHIRELADVLDLS